MVKSAMPAITAKFIANRAGKNCNFAVQPNRELASPLKSTNNKVTAAKNSAAIINLVLRNIRKMLWGRFLTQAGFFVNIQFPTTIFCILKAVGKEALNNFSLQWFVLIKP